MVYRILAIILFLVFALKAEAVREARPTPVDSRIKIMVYNPDDVFKYVGYYGYQASIELGKNEEVVNISMGDTTGWQIVPSGSRIFIKPIEKDATTNMTLITDKRTYYFELYAQEAQDIRDPDLAFNVKFIYPDEEDEENLKNFQISSSIPGSGSIDLSHPEKYNFNYYISGDEEMAPIKIFDDGDFTYLQFRDRNAELPAIFSVDQDLKESMVNYRLSSESKNTIVVERVFAKLSIRYGNKIVCVFNESFRPY